MQRFLGIAAGLLLGAGTAHAEGMRIEPGKWEFKTVMTMSMRPEPTVHNETRCMTEKEMDPQTFWKDAEGCSLSDASSDRSSMRWKLICPSPAGTMRGEAVVHSTGDTLNGTMKAEMSVNGQSMRMTHEWKGRRVGDCD